MKLLTVSDKEVPLIYSPQIKQRFRDINLAISSGDLSYYYLEYIISTLDIPLYYVRGNHAPAVEYGIGSQRTKPWGAIDLHRQVVQDPKTGLLLAGIEGSLVYNRGPHQYTQSEMWSMVMHLVPTLMWNKVRYGRYLDIFVTHAPPWGIHDQNDHAHKGVKAFNWLIETFQPTFHIHGHIHIYNPGVTTETKIGKTLVLNTYGYRRLALPDLPNHQTALHPLAAQTEDATSPNS